MSTPAPSPPEPTTTAPSRARRGLLTVRNILIAVVLVLFVWFAVENAGRVRVDWWVVDLNTRLIYVILVSFAFGVVADRLFQLRRRRSRKAVATPPKD